MKNLYGSFTQSQIAQTKKSIKGSIFFLLLCVDEKTKGNYENINVEKCFENLLFKIAGLNELLLFQPELVTIMSLLQSALMEYKNPNFDFLKYRKLVLDAGAEIDKLREVD